MQAAQLLQRLEALQGEAQVVLKELGLGGLLSAAGTFKHIGSSALGLVIWRDFDLAVFSPGLSIERSYQNMHPPTNQLKDFEQLVIDRFNDLTQPSQRRQGLDQHTLLR